MYYRWEGNSERPVLLLSHSLGACCQMWQPQVKTLGEHFHLLLYDHPGHGQSEEFSGKLTIEQLARTALGLLDDLGVETFHFCGLSLGGMIGMWLGVHGASRLRRLVISNTAARIADTDLLAKRLERIRHEDLPTIEASVLERWLTEDFRSREPETVAWLREMFAQTSAEGYIAASEAVCNFDFEDSLKQIAVPTLVLAGRQDLATPVDWNASIARRIPEAQLQTLDAAHLANIEAAQAYSQAVMDFLS